MVKKSERRAAAIRRKKRRTLLLSIVGGAAVLAAIGLFWFFNQSAPDEVSIESAAAGAAGEQSDSGNATVVDDVEGTWTGDPSGGGALPRSSSSDPGTPSRTRRAKRAAPAWCWRGFTRSRAI